MIDIQKLIRREAPDEASISDINYKTSLISAYHKYKDMNIEELKENYKLAKACFESDVSHNSNSTAACVVLYELIEHKKS